MTVYKDKMNVLEFEVSDYDFKPFQNVSDDSLEARDFEFIDFDKNSPLKKTEHQRIIKAERGAAIKNHFEIAPIVREHRGLIDQEQAEKEARIQDEVSKRVEDIKKQAYEKGHKEGLEIGRKEIIEQTKHEAEEKLQHLSQMIENVLNCENDLLEKHVKEIYTMTRSLTKWVILRELKDDDDYLRRLLEKIILEINTKANLLVKVSRPNFDSMPEILEQVESSLGKLKNIRLEIDDELDNKGLIVESDNGIINASMKQQFKSISSLFESLGVPSESAQDDEGEVTDE